MKINQLDLVAFGSFTDCVIDLSGPGTHLVVGPNEAGKSTAMEAVRQLFFGIPVRSQHAFLHEMRDLRLRAVLRDDSGELLEITRIKRQADTLRGPRDEIIDDAVLARFLHDVNETVYANLFTIGSDEIARGAEVLLASDGEVGRSLFSASRGTTDLNAVLTKLDERAGELFKPSASLPKLNAAIREYKERTTDAKQLSTSARDVVELDEALQTAQDGYDSTAEERKGWAVLKARLERVRAATPLLAARRDCLSKKSELEQSGPLVDPTIRDLLDEAQTLRSTADSKRRTALAAVERLDQKLSGLPIDSTLIAHRDTIDVLRKDSGGYRERVDDLPALVARRGSLERDIKELSRRLPGGSPLGTDRRSGLSVDQEERIRQLAEARPKLEANLEHATSQVTETSNSLDSLRRELNDLDAGIDVGALVAVATRIRNAGDLETRRTDAVRKLQDTDATITSALAALGLDGAGPHAVDAVAVPAAETIRRYRDKFAKLAADIDTHQRDLDTSTLGRDRTVAELEELLSAKSPPSEEDLVSARARRDHGWQLLRRRWIDGSDDPDAAEAFSSGESLEDAYEAAVEDADRLADRLRDEANAVERRNSLEGQLDETGRHITSIRGDLETARRARADAESSWATLWEPLGAVAQSPDVMEQWLDDFQDCARQSADARRLATEVDELTETIARHQMDLASSLAAAGAHQAAEMTLLGLLDCAELVVAGATETRQNHASLEKSRADTEKLLINHVAARSKAQDAVAKWREDWAASVAAIGLGEAALTNEATATLKLLSEIAAKNSELAETEERISGIEERNDDFTQRVGQLLATLDIHRDLASVAADVAVATVANRLEVTQEAAAKHRTTTEERESHEQDQIESTLAINEANDRIAEMIRAAGVGDEAQLSEAIERSKERDRLNSRLTELEEGLRRATGLTVSEIEREAREIAGVEIEPEIDELTRKIETADETLKLQGNLVGELSNRRSLIGPSGEAADAIAAAQHSLAAVVTYAEEYVQVLLAKKLLEDQVALYRGEHQGPLLARARDLFQRLTLNRYSGLDTDIDDKGNPHLLAVCAAGNAIEVGALSTGTRDQLYLALRLAALEQFIDRRGPLPLVLDDLFVHFDDERTEAGLAVLDQIAERTQVLLFTHHEQVAKQAERVIDADRLSVHHLA